MKPLLFTRRRPAPSFRVTGLGRDAALETRLVPYYTLTGRTWTITARDTDGTDWSGSTLVFTQQAQSSSGLQLDGYFDWRGSTGAGGRELFHGSLAAANNAIDLNGYDLVDPNGIVVGHYTAALHVSGDSITDGAWDGAGGVIPGTWSATAPPVSTPPTVSDIPDQPAVTPGTAVGPVAFSVGDAETPPGFLALSAASSNTALVPTASVAFGGSGASRTVSVTPVAGQTGTATITVTVSDGGKTAQDAFTVTFANAPANAPPAVGAIPALTATAGTPVAVPVTITDESPAGVTLSFASSNPALIQAGNIVATGTGASRTVTVTPAAGQTGTATVTVTATDSAGATGTRTFAVTVQPAAAPPQASELRQFAVGGGPGGLPTVGYYAGDGSPVWSEVAFDPSFTGGVRVATGDFNRDGTADVAVGTGPGAEAAVRVLDGTTRAELFRATPFAGFTGGVFVAAGDVTGDGVPELIVSPDLSGGPRVRVFRGGDFGPVADFFGINDPAFRGGARAAAGDIDGDGKAELVVAAGFGGGPRVALFSGARVAAEGTSEGLSADRIEGWKLVGDFIAFDPALRNGVYVAAGDLDGDGRADLIFGAGPGGGPEVRAVSGARFLGAGGPSLTDSKADPARLADFFAGDVTNRGGLRVAAKDLDGGGRAGLIVGPGEGGGSHVTAYPGKDLGASGGPPKFDFDAFPGFANGVFVG